MSSPEWLADLSNKIPASRLLTQPAQLVPYESDALTAYRSRPVAVVIPETQEEVVETVRCCNQHQRALRAARQRHQPLGRLAAHGRRRRHRP